jgi:hypothetical protein
MAKVLIACERSQVVCAAFRRHGIEAYSNDLEPCYGGHPEWHIIGDAAQIVLGYDVFWTEAGGMVAVSGRWSMIIAHPPCTMLTHSSAVAYAKGLHTYTDVLKGALFFMRMLAAPSQYVAVENPAPMSIAHLPPYSQIINPYDFGHRYSKRLCLWLKELPPLLPTHARVLNHVQWIQHCAGNSRRRSQTFEGIAEAMATQWGSLLR